MEEKENPERKGKATCQRYQHNEAQLCIKSGLTLMPLWMKPRRKRAGFRCGYSSVLVTLMPHTFFQAS